MFVAGLIVADKRGDAALTTTRRCPRSALLFDMSTTEQKQQQTPTPAELPFTQPQAMKGYTTDTGKILPRKYTHLSAKHQRAITRTIKHSRNMLLAQ